MWFLNRLKWFYKMKNGGFVKVLNREIFIEDIFYYEG